MTKVYFYGCLAAGWLLRSCRYSTARVVCRGDEPHVLKQRSFYAPLLVWLGGPLVRVLGSGVLVLRRRAWAERERSLYRSLYGLSIRIDPGGALVLPYLPGRTLAALLDDARLDDSMRHKAIEWAVRALAAFHRCDLTHGDAMADNVLIDEDESVARWFDFETIHEPSRPVLWRQADDLRALLVTCLLRTEPTRIVETLDLILDVYADARVTGVLTTHFTSAWRRPLAFHLAQAGLSLHQFREVARLLRERHASLTGMSPNAHSA
jgi:hypothetical protein